MQGQIAIIAGSGVLPVALKSAQPNALVFSPEGLEVALEVERFRFERLIPLLHHLQDRGVSKVVLAGAMQRPKLDPAMFDAATAQMVPRLLAAMQAGDDATLREMIAIIEEAELEVVGVEDIAPDLVPSEGVLTAKQPSAADMRDAARAAQIVAALGAVDVGQGAVVAQGLCLATESLPGTDAMLEWVADVAQGLRPDPQGAAGLFYKASKPGQERRVDLPTLGPQTLAGVARAGLAGIAWEAGGVIVLERARMVAEADRLGLFLWARGA